MTVSTRTTGNLFLFKYILTLVRLACVEANMFGMSMPSSLQLMLQGLNMTAFNATQLQGFQPPAQYQPWPQAPPAMQNPMQMMPYLIAFKNNDEQTTTSSTTTANPNLGLLAMMSMHNAAMNPIMLLTNKPGRGRRRNHISSSADDYSSDDSADDDDDRSRHHGSSSAGIVRHPPRKLEPRWSRRKSRTARKYGRKH